MGELDDLYQDIILDHGKRPRNLRTIPDANREAEGFNALCGDRVTVQAIVEDGEIRDIAFTGSGCAICTASASLMTATLQGMSQEEAMASFQRFKTLFSDWNGEPDIERLGKLAALAGVRKYPMRVKCATLPWHTMKAALHEEETVVSTE